MKVGYRLNVFKPPQWLRQLSVLRRGYVVVESLFIFAPIVCGSFVFDPCLLFSILCHSSVAITLVEKRELFALL